MEERSIKKEAFNGVIWNYINKFGTQFLQLVPTMVLARLLSPQEYGIVAMAAVLTSFLNILVDSGFSMALIQKKEIDSLDINSVFYFNIFISVAIYCLLFITAPFIGVFFNMDKLCSIIRVSSLTLVIGSLGAVQSALFTRSLDFKHPTIRNMVALVISASVGITCAMKGLSYWSLVIQSLVAVSINSILNWTLSYWKPSFSFSALRLKAMFAYGSKILIKNVTDCGASKIYELVIGKFYTPAKLSFFNKANATQNMLIDSVLMVSNSVAFSSFSKLQSQRERLRSGVLRFTFIEFMFVSCIVICVIALATPLFHFLYSSKWDQAIVLFRIICLWGIFRPIAVVFANGLMASGKSGICLKNSIIGRSLNVFFLLITWRYGLTVIIAGQVLAYFIEMLCYVSSFNKEFDFNVKSLLMELIPYFLISCFVGLSVCLLDYYSSICLNYIGVNEFVESICRLVLCCLFALFEFLLIYRHFNLKAYVEFRNIVYDIMANRSKLSVLTHKLLG